tara:strand:+ start:277 stop:1068 length:792 start_codon:yes stop_codon:yes gene_type:complete
MDLTYSDISYEALNTPVEDWRSLFNYMRENQLKTLFDAGAGHALSAQVAEAEFQDIKVYAYEIVSERIKDLDLPNQVVKCSDLFKDEIPKCDITFIYLPTGPLLERVLSQLTSGSVIAAIESHGDLFDRLDESAKLLKTIKLSAKRHHPKMKIYRWTKAKKSLKTQLRDLSFTDTYEQIHIREEDPILGETIWSADIKGVTVTSDDYVETLTPPRRFELNKILKITPPESIELIEKRRHEQFRKIFIKPYGIIEDKFGQRHFL